MHEAIDSGCDSSGGGGVAAGVYFYPRLTKKAAPANELTLSGNIEAHESLVSFKVAGRIDRPPRGGGPAGGRRARCWRGWKTPTYRQKVRIDEAAVRVRQSNLALTLAGTREQEIKASQQAMIDAQADLEQKKLDNDRDQMLFAKDEISAQDRDLAATALKRATATYKAAQQRYNEAVEGSRKEDIADGTRQSCRSQCGPRAFAHRRGLHHAARSGERRDHRSPGGVGRGGGAGFAGGDTRRLDHIWLRAYIAETDLGRIHWGQDATITTDTYPGKQYHGRISFISPTPSSRLRACRPTRSG